MKYYNNMANKYLTIDGVKRILNAIREKYVKTEEISTIIKNSEDLSKVAFTGKYSDLIDKPSTVDVPIATTSSTGIVKPGRTFTIDKNGLLNVKYNSKTGAIEYTNSGLGVSLYENGGLTVNSDNKLLVQTGDGISIKNNKLCVISGNSIEGDSWEALLDGVKTLVSTYISDGRYDTMNIVLKKSDYTISIDIDMMKAKYFNTTIENIQTLIKTGGGSGEIPMKYWTIPDCCETEDEAIAYEKLKILSSTDTVDVFELYLYNNAIFSSGSKFKNDVTSALHKEFYDTLKVCDINKSRFLKLDDFSGKTEEDLPKTTCNTFVYDSSNEKYKIK